MSVGLAEFEAFTLGGGGPTDITFALREFKVRVGRRRWRDCLSVGRCSRQLFRRLAGDACLLRDNGAGGAVTVFRRPWRSYCVHYRGYVGPLCQCRTAHAGRHRYGSGIANQTFIVELILATVQTGWEDDDHAYVAHPLRTCGLSCGLMYVSVSSGRHLHHPRHQAPQSPA